VLPADRQRWSYFVCGPPPMTDAAVEALIRLGIAPGAIRAERFALA
jgi:NAD(P)H-flavin reductase